jgi:hypothetical protein
MNFVAQIAEKFAKSIFRMVLDQSVEYSIAATELAR